MLILDFMCRPWSRQRRWNTTRRPCIAPNMIIFTLRRSTGTCQTNFISCICVTWVSSRPTHHRYLSPGGEPRAQYKACFIPYLFWIHYHLALASRLMEPEIICFSVYVRFEGWKGRNAHVSPQSGAAAKEKVQHSPECLRKLLLELTGFSVNKCACIVLRLTLPQGKLIHLDDT